MHTRTQNIPTCLLLSFGIRNSACFATSEGHITKVPGLLGSGLGGDGIPQNGLVQNSLRRQKAQIWARSGFSGEGETLKKMFPFLISIFNKVNGLSNTFV